MSRKNKKSSFSQAQEAKPEAVESQEQEMASEAELVDFDGWWATRRSKIPEHHRKEIIRADFKGRGLSDSETMEDFDAALKLYGLKLS